MKKKCKRWLAVLAAIILVMVVGFGAYVSDYYPANADAQAALLSIDDVTVTWQDDLWIFAPQEPAAGLIFYPGGKVEATAYAPMLQKLAQRGILCVLTEMPCNLAVLDRNAADGIPEQFPDISEWYIGGHSLGGAMAASYVAEHTDSMAGLILLGAYSTADLSDSGLRVFSAYGSEDGVLDRDKYKDSLGNLPQDTTEFMIAGGCHAGFGSYGEQDGDGTPRISSDEQQNLTADAIAGWL